LLNCGHSASRCENDIDLEPDELGRDLRHALAASFRPAIRYCDGASLDPAEFAQPLQKSSNVTWSGPERADRQVPDSRQLPRLLRARRDRQRCGHAAKRGDEFSPSDGNCHVILPREFASAQ